MIIHVAIDDNHDDDHDDEDKSVQGRFNYFMHMFYKKNTETVDHLIMHL